MTEWRLTHGLDHLRSSVNARWPGRDKASDGAIGDTAHQASVSGHNPDDTAGSTPEWTGDSDSTPEVRAWDMDDDLGEPGTTAQMLVDHLRRLPGFSTVIRYMIYNRTMYHERDGFAPTPYTGSSPHTEHIHFSGAWSNAADENTTFDYRLDEVGNMALTDDDLDKVAARTLELLRSEDGKRAIGQAVLSYDPGYRDGKPENGVWPGISDATYPPSPDSNGTVGLGTAIGSLLARQKGYGDGDRASLAQILTALGQLDEQTAQAVLDAIGAPEQTPEQTAAALRAVLGDQAAEVGRILAAA
jgi:hypothetical protein